MNHNGKLAIAKKLIRFCSKLGIEYIKFQTFKANELSTPYAKTAKYQKKSFKKKLSQRDLLKKYELSEDSFKKLFKYCKKCKIEMISTPFDKESAKFLMKLGCRIIKVSSGDLTDFQLLHTLASFKGKLILSTGMSNLKEIENSIKFLKREKKKLKDIILMHCTSSYPAKNQDLNMNALDTIRKKFNLQIGYSDHSQSQIPSLVSILKKCDYYEKHITINKSLQGPDHSSSFDLSEFSLMVKNINALYEILGTNKKRAVPAELNNLKIVRKSLVASKDIKRGEVFTKKNLTTKRPALGKSATLWKRYLGKKSKKNYNKNNLI